MANIKAFFKNLPLKNKIISLVMLITFISLATISTVFSVYNVVTAKQSITNELNTLGKVIGKRTAPGLGFANRLDSNSFVSNTKTIKHLMDLDSKRAVILACVYLNNSKLFAEHKIIKTAGISCPEDTLQKDRFSKSNYIVIERELLDFENKKQGYLYIISGMEEVRERILFFTFSATLLLIIIMLITYILAMQMQKLISKPISKLVDTANRVTEEKDYSIRAEKYNSDEIGSLTDTFNAMLSEIENRDKELQKVNVTLEEINATLEDKVTERTEELEKALESKNRFISNMSHEIRTPNHQVMGFSGFVESASSEMLQDLKQHLEKEPENEVFAELNKKATTINSLSGKIHKSNQRLARLLNHIIDLRDMFDEEKPIYIIEDDVCPVIDKAISVYAEKNNDRIKNNVSENSLICLIDKARILQVMGELIENALQYAPEGDITINLKKTRFIDAEGNKKQGVEFSISDQGVGIPEQELRLIFDLLYESSYTKTDAGGRGMGLAICREIILKHHGIIKAENNKGKGATFSFIIPLA